MFSQQPGRTVYVQPQVKYQAAASMGQNYSLMGTGPMGGQLFTGDATNAGGCPNPQLLLSPQPDPSQYNVQAAFQQQYPRPISPSEMSYFYNQPRPNSPGRMSSAPDGQVVPELAAASEVPQLTLPLSSRGTSGLPVQGGANSHAGSPSATSLSMELRAGAKQTWEAAAAQCSLSEEVKAFLGQMGFDCYLEAFRKAGFEEMDIVLAMSQDDMRSLGMLPGHVLKMDMKLDELCKSQGKVRRSKRLQFPPGGMPWMAMQAHAHTGPSPTAASPNGAAACIGMQAMLPMSRTIVSGTSTPMAPSPKAHAGKVQLALSPVRSNSPSPVEKDIQQFSGHTLDSF